MHLSPTSKLGYLSFKMRKKQHQQNRCKFITCYDVKKTNTNNHNFDMK